MLSAAGSAVAPSIIRHLQSLGHDVVGHDCNGFANLLSPTASDPMRYAHFLASQNFDVYLPFLDEELGLIEIRDWTSPLNTIETFTSKIKQQYAMESVSLPVAYAVEWGNSIAKPDHGRGGKGMIRTSSESLMLTLKYFGYLVQKFIDGDEYTIDVLTDRDGAFLFAVPRLRIQANGVSVIGKIVMDAEIIDLAREVVSKFKFAGPINIQVIRERDTGKLYIIEVNPRLSGSCMFTVMAGFDILDATIRLWEGKPFVPPSKIEDGLIIRRHYVEERL